MATEPRPAPSPAQVSTPDIKPWTPPKNDQSFIFDTVQSAPAWIDKGWASFDRGPALAVPMGNLDGSGPYHTATARPGDTVKFVAGKGSRPAHMIIEVGEPKEDQQTKRVAQESAASLEDALRTGSMSYDDLGADAKAQVAARTPALKDMVETGEGAPEAKKAK